MKDPNQNGYGVKDNLVLEYKFRKQIHAHSQTSMESFLLLVACSTNQPIYVTMVHKFLYFLFPSLICKAVANNELSSVLEGLLGFLC